MKPLAILVVDDQPIMREVIGQMLEDAGHEVRTASGGLEALQEMDAMAFDLLVTDIVMPRMDGLELIAEVRRRYPRVGVIAMSAGSEYFSRRDGLAVAERLGARVVLAKPFARDQLLQAIEVLYPTLAAASF